MQIHYDAIYLSPHLDDAALSCGGQIFTQTIARKSVLIVTIGAGDPPAKPLSDFASLLHERWELVVDAVKHRRDEDKIACSILGADYSHWNVPDCIYRYHPETGAPLYSSRDDIFGPVNPAESFLIEMLAQQLAGLPASTRIFAPLTVGHHVDHQLTRAAAERCFGSSIWYYEDYPYVQEAGALEAVIPLDRGDWQFEIIPLTGAALEARIEAIAAFASQMSTFFSSHADLVQQITEQVRRVGGERVWRSASSPS